MNTKHYKIDDIDAIIKNFATFMHDGKPHFLVVDDSGVNRKMMVRVLKELNYLDITEGKDGVECIALLNDLMNKDVIILLDLNMPRMDGLQCLKQIKSKEDTKHIPVIIVSTNTSREKIVSSVELGAEAYVVKPFTAAQISEKIEQILDK